MKRTELKDLRRNMGLRDKWGIIPYTDIALKGYIWLYKALSFFIRGKVWVRNFKQSFKLKSYGLAKKMINHKDYEARMWRIHTTSTLQDIHHNPNSNTPHKNIIYYVRLYI